MSINNFSSDHPETHWWSNNNPNSTQQQEDRSAQPNRGGHFIPQFYQDTHHNNYQAWLNSEEPTTTGPGPMLPTHFHTQNTSTTTLNFNLNQTDAESDHADQLQQLCQQSPPLDDDDDDKEPMFEKPLTPSDVGKLNRLVIPKQHAEKYFPLGGGDSGLLLSFEDEAGKSWRFRYSYWNSSQSYVLTKGWSRYVKEKRLDAGDVVLFERRRAHTDRLFIGWRRRSNNPPAHDSGAGAAQVSGGAAESSSSGGGGSGAGVWTRMFYSAPHHNNNNSSSSYPAHQYHNSSVAPYPPDCLHAAGSGVQNMNQTTSVGNSKILRLFGVNLECQQQQQQQQEQEPEPDHHHQHESEPSTPDGSSSVSMSSSQGPTPSHNQQQLYPRASYNYADHRDFTFSPDVNPMRNRRR